MQGWTELEGLAGKLAERRSHGEDEQRQPDARWRDAQLIGDDFVDFVERNRVIVRNDEGFSHRCVLLRTEHECIAEVIDMDEMIEHAAAAEHNEATLLDQLGQHEKAPLLVAVNCRWAHNCDRQTRFLANLAAKLFAL